MRDFRSASRAGCATARWNGHEGPQAAEDPRREGSDALLEVNGFDAAEEYIAENNPREQELYLQLEKTRARLSKMSIADMVEARQSPERLEILKSLQETLGAVLENVDRVSVPKPPGRPLEPA